MKGQDSLPVSFYKTDSGSEPVREWLLEVVTDEERRIIGKDIKIVQFTWPVGMPLVEAFGNGLWQVRSILPKRIARVFFTFNKSEIVLLHGFIKKSKKTPKEDLELAAKRRKSFKKG